MTDLKGASVIYQKPSGIVGLEPTNLVGERKLKLLKPSRVPVEDVCHSMVVKMSKGEYTEVKVPDE